MFPAGLAPLRTDTAQEQGYPGLAAPSPFYGQPQQLMPTQGQPGLPLPLVAQNGCAGAVAAADPAFVQHPGAFLGSGSAASAGSGYYTYNFAEQPPMAAQLSGQLPATASMTLPAAHSMPYIEVQQTVPTPTSAPALGIHPLYSQPMQLQQHQQLQQAQQAAAAYAVQQAAAMQQAAVAQSQQQQHQQPPQHQQQQQNDASAAKAAGKKVKRTYKNPEQQQKEKQQSKEQQRKIRTLEHTLGEMRKEHERLQNEHRVLQSRAFVLAKLSSFRRVTAGMVEEIEQTQQSMSSTPSGIDWGQPTSQLQLDAALKGLPAPELLDYLREMTLEGAVDFYNGVVAKVRDLLHQVDHGLDRQAACASLDDIFALKDKASTFAYLQVVNPDVYAQLMQAKLEPNSPVCREDQNHWRSVLRAMQLTDEQEERLILLLQSHQQQLKEIAARKSKVMQQLADEVSQNLLTLELEGGEGSGDMAGLLGTSRLASSGISMAAEAAGEDGREAAAGDTADSGLAGDGSLSGPLQLDRELECLMQLEFWLKFDFTGCVRKLLPPHQQARCMVASYPFYPDARGLEAAIREKAGPLWDQLQQSSSSEL